MKVVKGILLVVGLLVAITLVVGIFLPSRAEITRTSDINRPIETVFNYIADYRNNQKWNSWEEMDNEVESKITGQPGEMGQTYEWTGKIVGKGSLTLAEVEPYSYMKGERVFISPLQGKADDIWKFEALENGTRVNWTFKTELGYPLGRIIGLMMDSQLGPQLEEGLKNLKTAIEYLPQNATISE